MKVGHKTAPAYLAMDTDGALPHRSGIDTGDTVIVVAGIRCDSCARLIERSLSPLAGVNSVAVNVVAGTVHVVWQPAVIRLEHLLTTLSELGFEPERDSRAMAIDPVAQERRQALLRIGVAGLGAMQVMMYAVAMYAGAFQDMTPAHEQFLRLVSLLVATPVVVFSGRPFFTAGWRDLRAGRAGMDVPVALATGAAFAASVWITLIAKDGLSRAVYFDSVVMFVFLLSLGRYLEMAARHKSAGLNQALANMLPAMAMRLLPQGDMQQVAADSLRPGDHILAAAGETIPTDGRIVKGSSHVNEAMLTGEAAPRPRGPGDAVVGGSINTSNPLVVAVTRIGSDTVLSQIARLVRRAQLHKPVATPLANRIAAHFVTGVLLAAAATYFYWSRHDPGIAFPAALSVLVVTCPCALSLATPAALTAAIGRLAREGVLTARSDVLEGLAKVSHVIFDKTGTLTAGRIAVTAIRYSGLCARERALAIAAALERGDTHPIGRGIYAAASEGESKAGMLTASAVLATAGAGIEAMVDGQRYRIGRPDFVAELSGSEPLPGTVALGSVQGILATFDLDDGLRDDAAATFQQLRKLGVITGIASGDAEQRVSRAARELTADLAWWRLTPADKLARIRELQAAGAMVTVVGDGVNDAPVLAGADVSLALADGTALARASADLILLGGHLQAIPKSLVIARRCRRIVRQNIVWAVAYNLVALPLAAAGLLPPWAAAAGMSFSSLVVVLNAIRLNRNSPQPTPDVATT